MRFALTLLFILIAAQLDYASASAQSSVLRAEAPTAIAPQNAKRQATSARTEAQTLDGLYLKPVMSGLGDMRGILRGDDGTLYTLDQRLGRLYALIDRGGDGQLDGRRVVMDGLDRPSGLAIMGEPDTGERVLVSDAAAVWAVDIQTGLRRMIAPLTASGADIIPRPLLYQDGQILLGLSKNGESSVVQIDPNSGVATLVQSFDTAPLTVLAAQGKGRIWAGVGNSFRPLSTQGEVPIYAAQAGAPVNGLTFIHRQAVPEGWPDSLAGTLIASQGGANTGGYTVVSIASEFGQPSRKMQSMLSGFYNARTGTLWAYPDALLMTPQGLLMADRYGTLWQLSLDNRPPKTVRAPIGTPLPDVPTPKPSEARGVTTPMQGSLLGKNGSTITQGSTITTGSVLLEQWEAEKAAVEKADKSRKKGTPNVDVP